MSEEYKLPQGWVETKLEEVLPIHYGKGLVDTKRNNNGKVPVYGSSGIVGSHNEALTSTASLIIARKGSVGNVYYSAEPCWAIDTTYFAEVTPSTNLKFFLYLLTFLRLDQLDRSTAVPGLSRSDYNLTSIKIAPFPEQQRIVEAIEQQFSRLDAGVALLRQAQKKLKRYRASVLKAAVEGELTKEWRAAHPDIEPASELLKRILIERRAKWEEQQIAQGKDLKKMKYVEPAALDVSGLSDLPKGWCWAKAEQIADVGTGATPSRGREEYYEGGKIPWVTSGALNQDSVISADEFITEKALMETNTKIFPVGTLLVAMYGEGKTRGKVSELKIEAATNQACAAIVFCSFSRGCQPYVKYFLLKNYFDIRKISSGGVQPNLNLQKIKDIAIPLSSLIEQEQIVSLVEERLSLANALEVAIENGLKRAERQRQSILHQAFTGKLVPQDPNDEPASVLLERIRKELEQSSQEKGKQRQSHSKRARKMSGAINAIKIPDKPAVPIDTTEVAQDSLWQSVET